MPIKQTPLVADNVINTYSYWLLFVNWPQFSGESVQTLFKFTASPQGVWKILVWRRD